MLLQAGDLLVAQVILENVVKRYPGNAEDTVKNTSLSISDREFMILVGPSGCGKSTTLRMIAGLEEVTSGTIRIGDRDVTHLHPKDRDIAMVFQNYALYPHMTVRENMAFGLKLRGTPKAEIDRRVSESSKILGLDDLLERKPKAMSGGQRQRVALGRAIVREPKVFLMDEPLSNLDAKLRVQMRAEINKLHKRLDATVIYVTHDQTEAMTMGSRIAILNGGYVQQCDTPQVVYDKPANKFVAGFIGSPSINFFNCEVSKGQFKHPSFTIPIPKSRLSRMMSYDGVGVDLGIRPEHLQPVPVGAKTPEFFMEATVEVIEPMGAENYIYLRVGDVAAIARTPPEVSYAYGAKIQVGVNMEKLYMFEAASGNTIED